MRNKPESWYRQSGVIPYRIINGECRILLVKSRSGSRWIIPKGIIEENMTACESALKEALEEAGAVGEVDEIPIGEYNYEKWGGICNVSVFAMKVINLIDKWPEDFRERKWFAAGEAVSKIREDDLKKILRRFCEALK